MNHQAPINKQANIAQRLQDALNQLRTERNEVAAKKQLAQERLKMTKEEREECEKRARYASSQMEELKKSLTKTAKESLEGDLQQLKQDFDFQHSELVSQNEKLSLMQNKMTREGNVRRKVLNDAREMIRQQRLISNISTTGASTSSPVSVAATNATVPTLLQNKMNEKTLMDLEFNDIEQWPSMAETRATQMMADAAELHRQNQLLEWRIQGYKNYNGKSN